jgi:hypothetical protein
VWLVDGGRWKKRKHTRDGHPTSARRLGTVCAACEATRDGGIKHMDMHMVFDPCFGTRVTRRSVTCGLLKLLAGGALGGQLVWEVASSARAVIT